MNGTANRRKLGQDLTRDLALSGRGTEAEESRGRPLGLNDCASLPADVGGTS
jgi:hypothetical protein